MAPKDSSNTAIDSTAPETSSNDKKGRNVVDEKDDDVDVGLASSGQSESSSTSASDPLNNKRKQQDRPPSSTTASSDPSPASSNNNSNNKSTPPPEYNQKWFGYVLIMLTSLLNWTAVSSVPSDTRETQNWKMALVFGVMTFLVSLLVLVQDRTQKFITVFHYSQAKDGYVEGWVLLSMSIWWIVGVGYLTSPGGIAYIASNIYYSAWFCFFSCIYTLDEWSAEKDILSIEEITSVSYTLKGWWIHFFAGIVVFGSCIDLYMTLDEDDFDDTSFGIALGLVSMVVALFYILIHYDFFSSCGLEEGGWLELSSAIFLIVCWCIGLSILTQDGGVAATMEGTQCSRDERFTTQNENCTIVLFQQEKDGTTVRYELECSDVPRQIPGSNVFFASWTCMLSVVYVAFRWKAAQAIKFAQAKEEREQRRINGVGADDDNDGADYDEDYDDDDDDDLG